VKIYLVVESVQNDHDLRRLLLLSFDLAAERIKRVLAVFAAGILCPETDLTGFSFVVAEELTEPLNELPVQQVALVYSDKLR
jgi:uncharacterized membrane protein